MDDPPNLFFSVQIVCKYCFPKREIAQIKARSNNAATTIRAQGPHETGALGAGGREFESRHSDHKKSHPEASENVSGRLSVCFKGRGYLG